MFHTLVWKIKCYGAPITVRVPFSLRGNYLILDLLISNLKIFTESTYCCIMRQLVFSCHLLSELYLFSLAVKKLFNIEIFIEHIACAMYYVRCWIYVDEGNRLYSKRT